MRARRPATTRSLPHSPTHSFAIRIFFVVIIIIIIIIIIIREVQPALPDHFMTRFFQAHVLVDLQHADEGLGVSLSLESDFPESPAVIVTQAVAYSYKRNYDLSHEKFQKLLAINPHTVESMDVYSNILYVKEDHVELTLLA